MKIEVILGEKARRIPSSKTISIELNKKAKDRAERVIQEKNRIEVILSEKAKGGGISASSPSKEVKLCDICGKGADFIMTLNGYYCFECKRYVT